jgi:predicted Abi (CAAX) family protease
VREARRHQLALHLADDERHDGIVLAPLDELQRQVARRSAVPR